MAFAIIARTCRLMRTRTTAFPLLFPTATPIRAQPASVFTPKREKCVDLTLTPLWMIRSKSRWDLTVFSFFTAQDPRGLSSEALAAFGAATGEDVASAVGGHPGAEASAMGVLDFRGLVGFLASHLCTPLLKASAIIGGGAPPDNHFRPRARRRTQRQNPCSKSRKSASFRLSTGVCKTFPQEGDKLKKERAARRNPRGKRCYNLPLPRSYPPKKRAKKFSTSYPHFPFVENSPNPSILPMESVENEVWKTQFSTKSRFPKCGKPL